MSDAQEQTKWKTFNLKQNETQLLAIINANQQAIFAATLSNIAGERLGYQVTEKTQFKLNPQFTEIQVSELEEDVPVANEDKPAEEPEAPKSGAVTAK